MAKPKIKTRKDYIKQAMKNAPIALKHSPKFPIPSIPANLKPGTVLRRKAAYGWANLTVVDVVKETPKKIVLKVRYDDI